jgi:hypothetical protein
MKKFLAICVMVLFPLSIQAAGIPKEFRFANEVVINATACETFGPFRMKDITQASVDGAFTMDIQAVSLTLEADVSITMKVYGHIEEGLITYYSGLANARIDSALITSSTLTEFTPNHEAELIFPVSMPASTDVGVTVCGVASNPADTTFTGYFITN